MTQEQVDAYILRNEKYFPEEKIVYLKRKLLSADESKFDLVAGMQFKNPTVMLVISIFLGVLGIDRFMLGETGMGLLKLFTGGVCGVLAVIDWFTVCGKTKEKNYNKVMLVI